MPAARVVAVAPGSPAARAGVHRGDEIVAVNGEAIRDVIRYQILADEPEVELEVGRGGVEQLVAVRKHAGEPLGVELESAVFDQVRTCDNHCPFCFIHQLPKGLRPSLSVKDDDYRLSFLYGNFTTLTRFTEADLERVVTEGLSPLYVSIHATDPAVRTRLLRNRRGATSLRWLGALLDAGVVVHGQVVVCPGVNDGAVLEDTMLGILDRFPGLATVGVVPLGVSAHNREPEMRPHTREEAQAALETVHAWQPRFRAALGRHVVDASDEYYLLAGQPMPERGHYGDAPQHENGVGMARTFEAEVLAATHGDSVTPTGPRPGFFQWVDGAPATGYRAPREAARAVPMEGVGAPLLTVRAAARPVTILSGEYGAAVLEPLRDELEAVAQAPVRVQAVPNRFFGGNIAVTGLLTGADLAPVVATVPDGDRILVPDVTLSGGRFLDGTTPADLPRPVEVVSTDGASLVRALRPAA